MEGLDLHFLPKRTTRLTELAIIVMEQELEPVPEAGVPNLLFRPRMTCYVQLDHLSTRQFHDPFECR